jgi:hypothetical protein
MRSLRPLPLALAATLGALAADRPAGACGGCFHPPTENPTVVTDHRMIFAVSPQETTLYDQMRYDGAPSSFAWVLPIAAKVTVGLSSDELFGVLDAMTSVRVLAPPMNCHVPSQCALEFAPSVAAVPAPGGGGGGGVTVMASQVVGPYETVQLRADDPKALATWLSAHRYQVPPESQAIIDQYLKEGSAFLAMKLVPGATVRAMRPVRVTSPGASLTLPLRMVAAGAGATLGVTLWVVGQGRYEPQNFPSFTITAADVAWDWAKSSSDYTTVRAARTASSGGAAWQVESSLDLAAATITSQLQYAPHPDETAPARPPSRTDAGGDAGSPEKTPAEARREDLNVLFGGGAVDPATVRVTRLRADLSRVALGQDLRVQASTEQSALPNVVQVTREANEPSCAVYDEHCGTTGNAPRSQANATNDALVAPHRNAAPSAGGGKHWYSCAAAASPRSVAWSPVLGALAILGAAFGRRRFRSRPPPRRQGPSFVPNAACSTAENVDPRAVGPTQRTSVRPLTLPPR